MWSNLKRTWIGAVLFAGIIGLSHTQTDALEPVPASEFEALVNQDVKNLEALLASAQRGTKPNISKASRGMPSNAMTIALLANARIDGKNAANDAKMATLRDAAIDIAKAAGKKNFNIGAQVKALGPNMLAAPGINVKPMNVAALIAAGNLDVETLMYQFKKPVVGGLGIEQEIKACAKNGADAFVNGKQVALRVLAATEYVEQSTPAGGWAGGGKNQKAWLGYNREMREAANEILVEMHAKKTNPMNLANAFTKLDGACVRCHEVFK